VPLLHTTQSQDTWVQTLVETIARVGRRNPSPPPLQSVEPFQHFLASDGLPDSEHLDDRDGSCTRREILLRYLVVSAVLDQGPDIEGVRCLLAQVTNDLYRQEIRFLHRPIGFYQHLGIAIDRILDRHAAIKDIRAEIWATENASKASKYNLFMDNSKQVLNYAVFRWGVPLALPLLLERDAQEDARSTALVDYLESHPSAKKMSDQLKSHHRYGLGKAIGNKACHLFAKWMTSTFALTRRDDPAWGPFSFELPYDSNAGRVLWRTGYLLRWARLEDYEGSSPPVINKGVGKQGTDYIRVTNIRNVKATKPLPDDIWTLYREIAREHTRSHTRAPVKPAVHMMQHPYVLRTFEKTGLTVAHFDDGLIHIGTNYCFNLAEPNCDQCPLSDLCQGHLERPSLVTHYRT